MLFQIEDFVPRQSFSSHKIVLLYKEKHFYRTTNIELPCTSVSCARATGAPSLSVTRALPPARWLAVQRVSRMLSAVQEIQSYCQAPICRTANARSTKCAASACRRGRADFLPWTNFSYRGTVEKGNRDARQDGYVRVKGALAA